MTFPKLSKNYTFRFLFSNVALILPIFTHLSLLITNGVSLHARKMRSKEVAPENSLPAHPSHSAFAPLGIGINHVFGDINLFIELFAHTDFIEGVLFDLPLPIVILKIRKIEPKQMRL